MVRRGLAVALAVLGALTSGCNRDLSVPTPVAPVLSNLWIAPNPARPGDVVVAEWDVSAPPVRCEAVLGPLFSQCTILGPSTCHCEALVPAGIPESVYAAILSAKAEGGETRVFESFGIDQNPPLVFAEQITFTQDGSGWSVSAPLYTVYDLVSWVESIAFYGSETDPVPLATMTPRDDGAIPLLAFSGQAPRELWIEARDGVGHVGRKRARNVSVTAGLAGRARFRSTPIHLAPYFFDADYGPTTAWPGLGAVVAGEATEAAASAAAVAGDLVEAVTTALPETATVAAVWVTTTIATSPFRLDRQPGGAAFQTTYDAARRRTVSFGGTYGAAVPPACYGAGTCTLDQIHPRETWEFDGQTWTSVVVPGPSARTYTALGYDASRGRVVLFGGAQTPSTNVTFRLGDTWEWDGQSWTSVATAHAPTPRMLARLAYDAARGLLLLHGGSDGTANCDGGFQDFCTGTWSYDGADWTLLDSTGPAPARAAFPLVWSPASGDLLLRGGVDLVAQTGYGDFWRYDGTWSPLPLSAPVNMPPGGWGWDAVPGGCFDVARRLFLTSATEMGGSFREYAGAGTATTLTGGPTPGPGALFHDPALRTTYGAGQFTNVPIYRPREPHPRTAAHAFALDVAPGAALTSLAITHVGAGSGAAGSGLQLHAWNWSTRRWDLVGAHSAASGAPVAARTLTASPPAPAAEYLAGTKIWVMASAPASGPTAAAPSVVSTDSVEVRATYTLP